MKSLTRSTGCQGNRTLYYIFDGNYAPNTLGINNSSSNCKLYIKYKIIEQSVDESDVAVCVVPSTQLASVSAEDKQ